MPDDNLSLLADGVRLVIEDPSQWICEHRYRLFERNTVLRQIRLGLIRIPPKLKRHSPGMLPRRSGVGSRLDIGPTAQRSAASRARILLRFGLMSSAARRLQRFVELNPLRG